MACCPGSVILQLLIVTNLPFMGGILPMSETSNLKITQPVYFALDRILHLAFEPLAID